MKRLAIAAIPLLASFAQEYRSTISGRVLDPQQALIPGVRITATQVETGAAYQTVAGAEGQYAIPFLSPGTYRLAAEAQGFKKFVREGLRVGTNERISADIQLEIGLLADTVTVTAESPLLVTATASTGLVIDQRHVESMPLNGRSPLVLAQLAMGVVPQQELRQARPYDDSRQSNFSMGGAPSGRNELLLDGAPNTNEAGRVAYSPPVDSVAEVKVETFQADAAYGHTGGGTVSLVTKSGTNQLHGAAYDFNQVSRLAATPFFTNRSGQTKAVTRYNQWGVSAGGPVLIPKLIDGRNKVFFHFSYEGIRTGLPIPTTITVPTPAQRTGDFSELLRVGSAYQIYDPLTAAREGSRVRRQPFVGNIIPATRQSAIARRIVEFYGLPNQPGRSDGRDNFLSNQVTDDRFHSETGRLDFNISERHKVFFNFRHNERTNRRDDFFRSPATGDSNNQFTWGSTLDHVWSLSPTMVLNTRFGWSRSGDFRAINGEGFDFTTLGLPAALAAESQKMAFPVIDASGYVTLGDGARRHTPYDIYQLFSSVTRIVGSHSLKFGADLRLTRFNSITWDGSAGEYVFGNNWTNGPLDNSPSAPIGQGLAALLLGLPTSGSFDFNASRSTQAGYYSLFIQDDLRVSPNLSLNLGLRFERNTPTTERFNRSVNGFDFTTPSPISAAAGAAYARNPIPEIPPSQFRTAGGLLFASPSDRDLYKTQGAYFSPRFGVAWKPAALGGRTVLRAGTGVFVFSLGQGGVQQTGFSQSTPVVPTLDGFVTVRSTLNNPFPIGLLQPTGASLGLATYLGRGVSHTERDRLNPYSIRWNLDVQHELPWKMVVQAGYVGNHAIHMDVNRELNYVPREFLSTSPFRDQPAIDRLTANVANPFAGLMPGTNLDGSTTRRQQLLQPYPHFTGLQRAAIPEGSSYFHMFQTRVEKRFSHGFQFMGSYLIGKLMEKRSRLNDQDPFLEKRISGDDRPRRAVLGGTWSIPFAERSRAFGGWSVGGMFTWQPGPALNWGNVIYLGGDLRLNPRGVDGAFDTSRFVTDPRQQLASNIRTFPTRFGNLRADGINSIDFSVIKNTRLAENVKLQFRCEFFNFLNRPAFEAPNLNPTNTAFGRINSQANLSRSTQMALRLVW